MADQRRVDVADLRSASAQVGEESTILGAVHTETAATAAAARVGWVGSSAAALSAVTARWHLIAQAHTAAIGNHGGHMRASAQQFGDTEDRNAAAVADVGAAA